MAGIAPKNHIPQNSNLSTHTAPPNRNLFRFVTRSHRCDMRGIQAFPHQLSVLKLYPAIAAPWIPRWLRTSPVCDGSYALASLDPNTCGKYGGDYWATFSILVLYEFNITTRHIVTSYTFSPLIASTVRLFVFPTIIPLLQHLLAPMRVMQLYHTPTILHHPTSNILITCLSFLSLYLLTPSSFMLTNRDIHTHSLLLSTQPIHPNTIVIPVCRTALPTHTRYSWLHNRSTLAHSSYRSTHWYTHAQSSSLFTQPISPTSAFLIRASTALCNTLISGLSTIPINLSP